MAAPKEAAMDVGFDAADQAPAARFHFHAQVGRSRIQGVFEQLLHDARGPLDDFARSDFRDDGRW